MITNKGLFIISFTLSLCLISLLYLDIVFLLFPIALLVLVIVDYKRLKLVVKVKPSIKEIKLRAGSTRDIKVEAKSNRSCKLSSNYDWIELSPGLISSKGKIIVKLSPYLSGNYKPLIIFSSYSKLGLFETSRQASMGINIEVIPRTLIAVANALMYIYRGRSIGVGEETIPIPAREGFEYLYSRQYFSGDNIKRIDWNATARNYKLYIKQFLEESGSSFRIFYDRIVIGPVTADQVASALVTSVLEGVKRNKNLLLYLVENRKIVRISFKSPKEAILTSIRLALDTIKADVEEINILIDLVPSAFLERTLAYLKSDIREVLRKRAKVIKGVEVRNGDYINYISSLTVDIGQIVELNSKARALGGDFLLFIPSRPWVDKSNHEEREIIKRKYNRSIEIFKKNFIKYLLIR